MKFQPKASGAMTIVELVVTTMLFSALGLVIYSLLNISTILGAKNVSVNVAHEQARTAMLQMIQDFHSAVSLPALADTNGNPPPLPVCGASPSPTPVPSPTPAPGIAFQLWSIGPLKMSEDTTTGNVVWVNLPTNNPQGQPNPAIVAGQRFILRTHGIEAKITAVSGSPGGEVALTLDLRDKNNCPLSNVPVPIQGTSSNHIVCFITDRCSYAIANGTLNWRGPTVRPSFALMGNGMTNPTPFTMKLTNSGAPLYQFVAASNLSTAYANYANRGFISTNLLLQSQVPMRARLTDSQ